MKSNELVQLDREIEQIEKRLSALHQKRVKLAEDILAAAKRAGKSLHGQSPRPGTQRATAPKKVDRLTTEDVIRRLQNAVKAGGSQGLSAIEISKASGVKYKTTLKNLKKLNKLFTQKGAGSAARYSLAK